MAWTLPRSLINIDTLELGNIVIVGSRGQTEASIHIEDLTSDEAGIIRGQEQDVVGDLLWIVQL